MGSCAERCRPPTAHQTYRRNRSPARQPQGQVDACRRTGWAGTLPHTCCHQIRTHSYWPLKQHFISGRLCSPPSVAEQASSPIIRRFYVPTAEHRYYCASLQAKVSQKVSIFNVLHILRSYLQNRCSIQRKWRCSSFSQHRAVNSEIVGYGPCPHSILRRAGPPLGSLHPCSEYAPLSSRNCLGCTLAELTRMCNISQ